MSSIDHILKICLHTDASLHILIYYKYPLQISTVPSKVLDLQNRLSTNSQVTLIWWPPHEPNGKIVRYEVNLKVINSYVH